MASWRINELSKMTGISVRMLRHFNKGGCLAPTSTAQMHSTFRVKDDTFLPLEIIMLRYFFAFIFAILIATSSAGFCGECGCIPQSKLEKATNFLENIVHKYPIELVLAFSAAIMVGASVFFTCIDGHNSQNTRRSRKTDASQMQFWEHLRRVDYFNMQANHFNAQLEEMRRASANSY